MIAGADAVQAPVAPTVDFSNIPACLDNYPHFVMWSYEERGGKWSKMPKLASGRNAKTNAPTHHTLDEAEKAYTTGKFSGIGTVLRMGISGIDLDHVLSADGTIEPWAQEILDKFAGSYIEKSPGGDGFHILCLGNVGHAGKQGPDNRLETYDETSPRYLTMTGHRWEASAPDITDQQDALDWLHLTHGKPKAPRLSVIPVAHPVTIAATKSDQWIIEKVQAKNSALWAGNVDANASRSEADQALCNKIAYWTDEPARIDAIFRHSGLMREKWDEMRGAETYGAMTVNKAVTGTSAQAGTAARAKFAAGKIAQQAIFAQPAPTSNTPASLLSPLGNPAVIYHPQQMRTKVDKETGEVVFSSAKGTAENLRRLVGAYGVTIRYNEMAKDLEIDYQGNNKRNDLAKAASLTAIEDLAKINNFPFNMVSSVIESVACQHSYNPAQDWIESKPWDGTARLRTLFECLSLKDKEKEATSWLFFKKWMIGAAAILTGAAAEFEHVLVFVDPLGGTGKTRFFKTLCPGDFQADGVTLNLQDKDSRILAVKKWLVELGELDSTFKKSDIAALKGFLSLKVDSIRLPYGKTQNDFKRRTAFMATVNDTKFLSDDTSNRRFWPIEVTSANFEHGLDMQQVWAEVLGLLAGGENWYLSPEENRMVAEHNEAFRLQDGVEEAILQSYDLTSRATRKATAKTVLQEIGIPNPTMGEMRKAGAILLKHFAASRRGGMAVYAMPEKSYPGLN